MEGFDAIVVGAGAAGLYAAAIAGQRGVRVLVLDHAAKVAEKIRISGGGRCNFTNRHSGPADFSSDNPDFCRSALARHPPAAFVDLVRRHRIGFHEKHRGQLFCDDSSQRIVRMLLDECAAAGARVERRQPCAVHAVRHVAAGERTRFELDTDAGPVAAPRLVVATGGPSIPALGASDWGQALARRLGHRVVALRPALVPLTFDAPEREAFAPLAGVALPVAVTAGEGRARRRHDDDLLFTHRGLSGPAVLQASTHWRPGQSIEIDLLAGVEPTAAEWLDAARRDSRRQVANLLAERLPQRLAERLVRPWGALADRPAAQWPTRELRALAAALDAWRVRPSGTEGWKKAEVCAGGVDTRDLDSRTLRSRVVPGLHFIGEVVDVTGALGGHNFQWAWSSAHACAQAIADDVAASGSARGPADASATSGATGATGAVDGVGAPTPDVLPPASV